MLGVVGLISSFWAAASAFPALPMACCRTSFANFSACMRFSSRISIAERPSLLLSEERTLALEGDNGVAFGELLGE